MLTWWLLACTPAPEPVDLPWFMQSEELRPVFEQQERVNAVSLALMQEAVAAEVTSGELTTAANTLAVALAAWPEDPLLLSHAESLRGAAANMPQTESAPLWAALAQLPEHAVPARAALRRARLLMRLEAPEALAAAVEGVSAEVCADALELVDARYVIVPPYAQMAHQARQELSWLDASVPWGEREVRTLDQLQQALLDATEAGAAQGYSEALVAAVFTEAAIASLDPWSRPIWPAEISSWQAGHQDVVLSVAVRLREEQGQVRIAHPLPDTQAWTSPVRQGDTVMVLADENGTLNLAELPVDQRLGLAERALIGDPSLPVTLTLDRDGQALEVVLPREPVTSQTVEGWRRSADNDWDWWVAPHVAYVRIPRFKPTTLAQFDAAMTAFPEDTRAVLLDLRGNPGGDVNSAVQLADRFIAEGLLAEVEGRVAPETTGPDVDPVTGEPVAAWNDAIGGHGLEGVAVAVLVDRETASAAEVLAGSLQERAEAQVLGETTWGKGHMQALLTDEAGRFALQLTNLVWALPSGRQLWHRDEQRSGIAPDFALPPLSPGERYLLAQQRTLRTSLRAHHDGHPIEPMPLPVREDLPPLSADPHVEAAAWMLQQQRTE